MRATKRRMSNILHKNPKYRSSRRQRTPEKLIRLFNILIKLPIKYIQRLVAQTLCGGKIRDGGASRQKIDEEVLNGYKESAD